MQLKIMTGIAITMTLFSLLQSYWYSQNRITEHYYPASIQQPEDEARNCNAPRCYYA